ncbi:hypothetical protein ADUPG1_013607 [Aduncisulcus paluster]|uniref:Tc1-like transposase DDE domain-containing protein n=1 Tax=Aduncisulcus paluster TaxID=2918883 RepID=A0ABQ5K3H3_9EUKA|nr:hypothetical protein ADUPG1_013607 [Aduncisulcus paluster]
MTDLPQEIHSVIRKKRSVAEKELAVLLLVYLQFDKKDLAFYHGVHPNTLTRWKREYFAGGWQQSERAKLISGEHWEALQELIHAHPSMTLDEMKKFLGQRGCQVSLSTVSLRSMHKSGLINPEMNKNHVFVMDNASIHKTPAVRAYLAEIGATLILLPPYCPFLTPVENGFSVIKAKIRKNLAYRPTTDMFTLALELDCILMDYHYKSVFKTAKAIGYGLDGYHRSKTTQLALNTVSGGDTTLEALPSTLSFVVDAQDHVHEDRMESR